VPAIHLCHFWPTGHGRGRNAYHIIALSGDYRSKEVAYTLVPAIGRRVLDLGETLEKGDFSFALQPLSVYSEGGLTT
jgi:hypothetical protein